MFKKKRFLGFCLKANPQSGISTADVSKIIVSESLLCQNHKFQFLQKAHVCCNCPSRGTTGGVCVRMCVRVRVRARTSSGIIASPQFYCQKRKAIKAINEVTEFRFIGISGHLCAIKQQLEKSKVCRRPFRHHMKIIWFNAPSETFSNGKSAAFAIDIVCSIK